MGGVRAHPRKEVAHTPVKAAQALHGDGFDAPGDWTVVVRRFRDGQGEVRRPAMVGDVASQSALSLSSRAGAQRVFSSEFRMYARAGVEKPQ